MSTKTTLITHIFNEEYLLPFWLYHHKDMFDNIIIIDYNSTDNSIEICKKICPECIILKSINAEFDATAVDMEIMHLEMHFEGIKIALTVTEFLFTSKPIKDIFLNAIDKVSYKVKCNCPYSANIYNVNNNYELFNNLLNDDIIFNNDRGFRYIHNYPHGNYGTGRHLTRNETINTDEMHIIWFGFYPLNGNILKRRLQIQDKMSQHDKDVGFGFHHLTTEKKLLSLFQEYKDPMSLKSINLPLYNIINNVINDPSLKKVNYFELLLNNDWGEDVVMIDNDINLLKHTNFDDVGYKIFDIKKCSDFLQTFLSNEILLITNKKINLNNYHNEINDDEHTKILNSMPYKKNMYEDMYEFCDYLENYVSTILNEPVKILNNDLWFRICRPSKKYTNDFNPCHKDVYLDFYRNTVNIYLPVIGSDNNSSLKMQPGSHKWSENETIVTKGGAFFKSINKKYSVDAIVASKQPLEMVRPNPNENQLILFSPYLIHGCADNYNENTTRISLEVRFIRHNTEGIIQEIKLNDFLNFRNWR